MVKNPPANAGDMSLILGSGRSRLEANGNLHSCSGEGNDNPLQYSCLENPRDGGAWWAAIYGVAQSQTRLKRLSSSRQPIPVFLSGRLYGQRSLEGYSPWNHKESDTTEQLNNKNN